MSDNKRLVPNYFQQAAKAAEVLTGLPDEIVVMWPEPIRIEPHRHDCYCSGWSHDDAECQAGEFYPCEDCRNIANSGEEL